MNAAAFQDERIRVIACVSDLVEGAEEECIERGLMGRIESGVFCNDEENRGVRCTEDRGTGIAWPLV